MTELAERNDYLAAGTHIGMQEKKKHMLRFVFKRRPDGLNVIDVERTDKRIKDAGSFLARYDPERVLVVSRKKAGREAADLFADAIGARAITGRFMPGSLTNPDSPDYFETDVVLMVDPASDDQARKEAVKRRIPIVSIADTYNDTSYIDLIIPGNNKGEESIGLILYLLAREVLENRGEDDTEIEALDREEFMGE